jgi:hypothetical protein
MQLLGFGCVLDYIEHNIKYYKRFDKELYDIICKYENIKKIIMGETKTGYEDPQRYDFDKRRKRDREIRAKIEEYEKSINASGNATRMQSTAHENATRKNMIKPNIVRRTRINGSISERINERISESGNNNGDANNEEENEDTSQTRQSSTA